MKISVIIAHPKKDGFNHAIADIVVKTLKHLSYEVFFPDLYAEKL